MLIYANNNYFTTPQEFYYNAYCEELSGYPSAEKDRYIETEQKNFDNAELKVSEYYDQYAEGKLAISALQYYLSKYEPDMSKVNAFDEAKRQYAIIKAKVNSGEKAQFINQTGWNLIFA